jgi:phosphate:Na+ symporter
MKVMSEGIQKAAGQRMRSILNSMTANQFRGIFTGFLTTTIIQSSSATTVMVVSFVNAGLLNLRQAFGVIMGANIGTTITSWLIVIFGFGNFDISSFSLAAFCVGNSVHLFSKKFKRNLPVNLSLVLLCFLWVWNFCNKAFLISPNNLMF